jgi:hypothetical protein
MKMLTERQLADVFEAGIKFGIEAAARYEQARKLPTKAQEEALLKQLDEDCKSRVIEILNNC